LLTGRDIWSRDRNKERGRGGCEWSERERRVEQRGKGEGGRDRREMEGGREGGPQVPGREGDSEKEGRKGA
jgi:hypothetical protein